MAAKGKKTFRTGVLIEPEFDIGNAGKSIAERHSAPYAVDRLEEFQGICKGIAQEMGFAGS
jgi:hypothetical protein